MTTVRQTKELTYAPDAVYREATVIDGSIAPLMDGAQLARMKASGISAFNWTVCSPADDLEEALGAIADGLEFIRANADDVLLVRSTADIARAKSERKVGLIFGPQNAKPAEDDLRYYRILHELGVRVIQLTYNERNLYGDGATEAGNAGLSAAGRAAIAEMNRLGILIDLSHCGDRTTLETIEASSRPVAITHANSRSVFASPRNKTDEALKLLAARDGVVGLTLWSPMVGSATGTWPELDDFLVHVRYVCDLIGPEHVAIGTDHSEGTPRAEWEAHFGSNGTYRTVTGGLGDWYTYDSRFTRGFASCSDVPRLAPALAGLGFSRSELVGLLGGNFLRLFERVWPTDAGASSGASRGESDDRR